MGVGPQRYRLQRKPLSQLVNQEIKYWILQSRESQDKDWTDLYAFNTDVEFSPEDFAVMNLATSRLSIFVGLVCCARTILVDELTDLELERNDLGDTGGAVGRMLLNGNVFKRRIAGKTGVVDVGTSEGERAAGLGKWFGIALSEEQRSGIKGRKSEL